MHVIRDQIASALNMIIHIERVTGGRRKVSSVAEITGTEGDTICLQEIFRFRQTGISTDGHAEGHFEGCGVRPQLLNRLIAEGIRLPADLFQHRRLVPATPQI